MSLTSVIFFAFLAILSIVYFVFPKKYQWIVLLVGSYVFYLSGDVRLVIYILFSTATSFFGAKLIEKRAALAPGKENPDERHTNKIARQKKAIRIHFLILNFAILAYFKHLDAWIGYLNTIFSITGVGVSLKSVSLILPLGISFYTFQSMGYLVDVYRGKIKADRNIAKFGLFISFFPQLIQGPISRYDELAHQFFTPHKFEAVRVKHGVMLMLWGLFKKLVIADRIAVVTGAILSMDQPQGAYVVYLAIFYSFQIYADFSGGVDTARGAAQLLGIDLPQNFLRPYFAKSMPEFWRRWHVTLNNWWRDYIFYPVVFSGLFKQIGRYFRKKKMMKTAKLLPIYTATMVVRVVNAMWHGASVKYLVNGFYNGAVIILGMQLHPLFMKIAAKLRVNTECFSFDLFRMLRTFFLVGVARLVTVTPQFHQAREMLATVPKTFTSNGQYGFSVVFQPEFLEMTFSPTVWFVLFISVVIWFAADIINEKEIVVRDFLEKQNMIFQWIMILALIFWVLIFGVYGPEYDATAFIYQKF
jgi:D-alanyl-lipoteichoic acid acyltransferase DltB (MBOAT superfamily)